MKIPQAFKIRTPPGADNGTRLRLAGEGEMGRNGGPAGDLNVILSVRKHPLFTRSGNDLSCEIPVELSLAFKGTEVEAPTLKGPVRIKIPPRTPPGKVFILKGMGMPSLEGRRRGDLKVLIQVEAASRPGKAEREMMEELSRQGKKGKMGPEEASFPRSAK